MLTAFRTLFACWMAIVLTGTATHHRHAGSAGHTHGLGWAVLHGGCTSDRLPMAHCHLVLLGIELGAIPAQFYAGESDGTHSASGQQLSVDDFADSHAPLIALVDPYSIPDLTNHADADNSDSVPTLTLNPCPLVSHARTGVLRT